MKEIELHKTDDLKTQMPESHQSMDSSGRKDDDEHDFVMTNFPINFKDKLFKIKQKDTFASPTPIGLFAFGLCCFLLSLHNASAFGMSPVILASGMTFGGIAQYITGIFEWIKGRSFTAIVFVSYGMFWCSFVVIFAISKFGWVPAPDGMGMACFLFIWGIFTIGNCVASYKGSKVIWVLFCSVGILIFLLAASKWSGNKAANIAAGAIGIAAGIGAVYSGAAEFINEIHGRVYLPLITPGEKICEKFSH